MILVDSSVWIDWFNDRLTPPVRVLSEQVDPNDVLVADLVLLEVLRGAAGEPKARRIEQRMRKFVAVEVVGHELAIAAARNFRMLRQKGVTIRSTVDIIIGTYCIEHGHQLLQSDRDFLPMAEHLGLQLL